MARRNDDAEKAHPAVSTDQLLKLATGIVCAYLGHNQVPLSDVPTAIKSIHAALAGMSGGTGVQDDLKPAVPIKKSIGDDFIICLEDGKKLKMLKRYLRTRYKLSLEEYRKKWGLPHDYPMVAPAYSRKRSAFAKKIGLGRIPSGKSVGRKRKAA